MPDHSDNNNGLMNEDKPETAIYEKKAYSAPRLVVYGDIRSLTMGGGGVKADNKGGPPNTKA